MLPLGTNWLLARDTDMYSLSDPKKRLNHPGDSLGEMLAVIDDD
jgi:hypothetical protein